MPHHWTSRKDAKREGKVVSPPLRGRRPKCGKGGNSYTCNPRLGKPKGLPIRLKGWGARRGRKAFGGLGPQKGIYTNEAGAVGRFKVLPQTRCGRKTRADARELFHPFSAARGRNPLRRTGPARIRRTTGTAELPVHARLAPLAGPPTRVASWQAPGRTRWRRG